MVISGPDGAGLISVNLPGRWDDQRYRGWFTELA